MSARSLIESVVAGESPHLVISRANREWADEMIRKVDAEDISVTQRIRDLQSAASGLQEDDVEKLKDALEEILTASAGISTMLLKAGYK